MRFNGHHRKINQMFTCVAPSEKARGKLDFDIRISKTCVLCERLMNWGSLFGTWESGNSFSSPFTKGMPDVLTAI